MRKRSYAFIIIVFVLLQAAAVLAQDKLLTIDDIFDPAKRVNFSGTPANPRWLKDGVHYIVATKERTASPRLLKVNAITGKSEPFYDSVKMEAAFAALPYGDFLPRASAALIYVVNPFVYGRLHYGQLYLVAAYAVLPWLALRVFQAAEPPVRLTQQMVRDGIIGIHRQGALQSAYGQFRLAFFLQHFSQQNVRSG